MLKKSKIRSLIAILIMAILPVGLFFWMTYEKDLLSTPVLVAKADIEMGTVIDDPENYFKVEKIEKEHLISNSLTPEMAKAIIGKGLKQFVPANGQVNAGFFDNPGIIVSGDKKVFKIPSSWVYAVPSSIRRGDNVKLYEVDSNIEKNLSSMVGKIQGSDSLSTYDGPIKVGSKDPILSSTVIYVKDGSNREVVDAAGVPRRYDGTSQVSSIEIVCTQDEIQKLIERVQAGFKFIIVY